MPMLPHFSRSVVRSLAGWLALGAVAAPAVVWESKTGCRMAPLQVPPSGQAGFTLLAPAGTGITFTNVLPESRFVTNQVLPNGAGVAAGDVDGDGWCDLYFCGLSASNRLYRNLGNWQFEDITGPAGTACPDQDSTGAAFADLDGDGDLDLVVNSIGNGTRLFFNSGPGRFQPGPSVLNQGRGGTSLALADADDDGDLDLYLANYRTSTLMDAPGTRFTIKMVDGQPLVTAINGRPPTDPEWTNRFRFKFELGAGGQGRFSREELGEPDLFLLNDGRGDFTPVAWTDGTFRDENGQPLTEPCFDWGLSVLFRDLDGDARPDLYLCNDFATPDRFWRNVGQGRFRLVPRLTLRQTSLASMAADVADVNRDGHDDLFVVEMLSRDHRRRLTQRNVVQGETPAGTQIEGRPQYPRNTLFLNRGDETYAEIAQYAGLDASEWSWGPIFLDVDLDGFEDVLVPNGFERDNMNADVQTRIRQATAGRKMLTAEELQLRRLFPRLNTANLAFRNEGALRFVECGESWGFDQTTISQGACLADLDNDGDLDVVVNNLNDVAGVYRNDSAVPRIAVRLRGTPPNTAGIGARIEVSGGPVVQSQQIVCGGRYCSSDQAQRTFAAGAAPAFTVRVRWRNGQQSVVSNVPPNHLLEMIEPPPAGAPGASETARPQAQSAGAAPVPTTRWYADVSDRLGHVHEDPGFDDFDRQPLLPRRLSQLGPGVAWWDLDSDGRDDLIVGSGRGGRLALFLNRADGRIERSTSSALDLPLERDSTGFAGFTPGCLLVACANYEDGATRQPGVVECRSTGIAQVLPLAEASFGPLAVADYDGDGALDLFVGARVLGGRYPAPVISGLYRRKGAAFEVDAENQRALPAALVSSAIWSDLTGDGWPELVLACDWGPLRIFRNDRGRLRPWNPSIAWPDTVSARGESTTLQALTGWWNGIAAGDLDNDGRLDLVAANWGQNTRYQRWRSRPLHVDYGDFNQDGFVELLENHYVPELEACAPDRMLDVVTRVLPQLGERFPTHEKWAHTTMNTVLAEWRDTASHAEAAWLESILLLNRGDSFEVRVLPAEAQFAPAFAVCVGDADGDGDEDVFLSQNFYGVDSDTSRSDAGRGLWLRGDGRGQLTAVPGQESGILVYGEQRGAALADFDEDGRVDLVVTQNRAETKLYRNLGGAPGLRVQLEGPPGNPCGIGAVLRLHYGPNPSGPARELRAGSGYWSQDSPIQVLGAPAPPTELEVRWPGGHITRSPLSPDARSARIRYPSSR